MQNGLDDAESSFSLQKKLLQIHNHLYKNGTLVFGYFSYSSNGIYKPLRLQFPMSCKTHLDYICASTHYLRRMEITGVCFVSILFDYSITVYVYEWAICTHDQYFVYIYISRVATYHLHTKTPGGFLAYNYSYMSGRSTERRGPNHRPRFQLHRLLNMYQSGEKNTDTAQVGECKAKFWLNLLPLYRGTL